MGRLGTRGKGSYRKNESILGLGEFKLRRNAGIW